MGTQGGAMRLHRVALPWANLLLPFQGETYVKQQGRYDVLPGTTSYKEAEGLYSERRY